MKNNRTILALGDTIDDEISYRNRLFKYSTFLSNNGVELIKLDYDKVENNELPKLESPQILGFLFFPQKFRNKNIRSWIEKDKIFGGNTHLEEIDKYNEKIGDILTDNYENRLKFMNSPEAIKKTRDKRKLKDILEELEINHPERLFLETPEDILRESNNYGIFIKLPGWGYGQGITYVKKEICKTNLIWDGHVINPDYDIKIDVPIKISKPKPFLEKLLEVEPLIEKEVDFVKIDGQKFDIRMYVVGNPYVNNSINIPFWFPRVNDADKIITNWARGGKIRYDSEFREQIPKESISVAKKDVIKLSKKLGINYCGTDIIFDKEWKPSFIEAQVDCGLPLRNQFDLLLYVAQKLIES